MVRTQIQFEERQLNKLRRLSIEKGESISALVREAVERYTKAPEDEGHWRRALAAVGKTRSGRVDISVNHDRYLSDDLGK